MFTSWNDYLFDLCTICLRSMNCPFGFGIRGVDRGQYYWLHGFVLNQSVVSCATVFALCLCIIWPLFYFGKQVAYVLCTGLLYCMFDVRCLRQVCCLFGFSEGRGRTGT